MQSTSGDINGSSGGGALLGRLRALSTLLERAKLASRAGITFDGKRDVFGSLGYKKTLKPDDYRARYRRNAIAARIVEAHPKSTWRGTAQLVEDEDPHTETEFEKAAAEFAKRTRMWSAFLRADILSGLGRFAVILIGAPGKLEDPLPESVEGKAVAFLSVFGEEDVDIKDIVDDPRDERFGEPKTYTFKRLSSARGSQSRTVHWSRVIHVADGVLDDPVYGTPRMERVWNLLDDLEKVTGGGAEAVWLNAHRGYVASIDKDLEMDEDDIKDLKDQVEEFAHQLRRTVGQRGIKLESLGSDVPQFGNPADAILTQIAGGVGIPKRVLTGSEMGELASSQDRRTWEEQVLDRRAQYAGPHIVRPLIDRLIQHKALPEPKQYEVSWPQIGELNDKERAAVANQWALVNQRHAQAKLPPVISVEEIRDRVLQLPPRPRSLDGGAPPGGSDDAGGGGAPGPGPSGGVDGG